MSDKSTIEWTDATWNPTTGCTKVSPGCAHCYIERTPAFRIPGNKFVHGKTDITIFHDRLEQPLHWRKPRRVFVNSLSDLFHDDISDAFIDRVFAVMAMTPRHTYQVLTKRSVRMHDYLASSDTPIRVYREFALLPGFERVVWSGLPLPNVWPGVSVENQHFADERIPLLLQTPAAVRFISAEPLLGPVDLFDYLSLCRRTTCSPDRPAITEDVRGAFHKTNLDWVIVGGESGPGARAFDLNWARSIIAQCQAAGVPVFVKQLGAHAFEGEPENGGGGPFYGLHDRKGGNPDEWPDDLRVREFPEARA